MKLYSGPLSMFGAKVQIAAIEKEVKFELVMVPFNLATGYEPKDSEVVRINPKMQVPVLTDGAVEIFDSTQILEYLEDLKPHIPLWPASIELRAKARLLEHLCDETFFPNVHVLMKRQTTVDGRERITEAKKNILAFYQTMSEELGVNEFLIGDFSYADIAFFMAQFFASFLRVPIPANFENLQAWKSRMNQRASVTEVIEPMRRFLSNNQMTIPS